MSAWAVASNDDTVGPSRVPPLGPFASTSPSISSAVTRRWTVERGRFTSLAMAVRLSPPGCALSARMMAAVRDTTCTPALGSAGNSSSFSIGAPQVTVQEVQAASVPVVNELPGRTAAFRVAEVRPQVNGIVKQRLFTEGSEVEAGEQLYQIDDATYQATYRKAMANLRTAELQAKRYAELAKVNAVSRQAHDDAQAAYPEAQAEAELGRINLEYSKVRAPISGRIGRSAVSEGALVTNGQHQAMATVQQLDPIYVDMTQSATELLALRKALEDGRIRQDGQGATAVRLRLEDGSLYARAGVLQFSEVEVSPGPGSVTLRARFPTPDRKLLPGMFVHAQVDSGLRDGVYLVPNQA